MSVILFCKIQFSDILLCLHIAILQNLSFFFYVRFNMFMLNALANTLQLPFPTENMFRFGNFGIFTVKKKLSFKGALSLRKRYFTQHCLSLCGIVLLQRNYRYTAFAFAVFAETEI